MLYNCLKCPASGIVDDTFLEELGIFLDEETRKDLKVFTKKSMRLAKLTNMSQEKFFVPLHQKSYLNDVKLEYINQRIGLSLGYTEAKDRKIILDVYEFMKANDLLSPDREVMKLSNSTLKNLNTNYVGFLSTNNNCIIFRDITGKQKYRYFKTTLNERNVNADSFYSIPFSLPLIYTTNVHVHIAEGTFDILSIKENIVQDKSEVHFFFAICGFGGVSVLKYLIHHAINTGIQLHIYSDNDKSDWDHRKYLFTKSYLTDWIDKIFLHRNQFPGEKDFGIPKEKIVDSYRELKRR